jgi:hypothetical protein
VRSATVIDLSKLLEVALTAVASGIGVSTLFALAVLGGTRVSEPREGSRVQTIAYGALALGGLLGFAAAIVYGIVLLTE